MCYRLTLTEADAGTIAFVGHRYDWSATLLRLGYAEPGEHDVPEPDAWQIREGIDADCEGGHSPFPLLDPRSALAAELARFYEAIV